MSLINLIFGTESDKFIKKIKNRINKVREHRKTFENLTDEELKSKTSEFKSLLSSGKTLDDILEEVFAVVSEVSKRTTGLDPFDVQLMGSLALHEGNISEMKTGEGKTLVAVAAAYLNALTEKPVHIITVNDYLARRDAVWMGQIFAHLGISVGVINGQNNSYLYDPGHREKDKERDEKGSYKIVYDFLCESARKEAYKCDVVYGTNNEYAFDYLRDNIEMDPDSIRQRGFYFAIVDEVDSILIDEARSPLIISAPANIPASHYVNFAEIAKTMVETEDYTIDEKQKAVSLTEEGVKKFEKILKIDNVYIEGGQKAIHYLQNALKAKSIFKKDKQYVIRDNQVVIVDEFTGRLQPGRQWSEGLHQAIEAKEGVVIQQESRTYASITYQNFFKMYEKLSGMTGTAKSSEEEFFKVYKMPVVCIPTNKTPQRIDSQDLIYQTQPAKLKAIVQKIKELNEKGQPVLVGTASIDHNEALSKKLKKAGVKHELLNAKNHEMEGDIISRAGGSGAVTIATNLAGRGVDIKLGGNSPEEADIEKVKKSGGLFVLGTERHESRRIDDQLRGRCGRQGDVGETQFYISLQDDLSRIFGSEKILSMAQKLGLPEEQALQNKIISNSIESAQKRIEGHYFDARRFSLQYDTVLNKHRVGVYDKRRKILFAKESEAFANYIDSEKINTFKDKYPDDYVDRLKRILLRSIDFAWMEHLELMDYAKSSVNLRSYGQREPLMEYRKESMRIFSGFWDYVQKCVEAEVKAALDESNLQN